MGFPHCDITTSHHLGARTTLHAVPLENSLQWFIRGHDMNNMNLKTALCLQWILSVITDCLIHLDPFTNVFNIPRYIIYWQLTPLNCTLERLLETFSPYIRRWMCWDLKQMSRKLQSSENDSYCIADPKQVLHEKQQTAMSSTESGSIQTLTSALLNWIS